mgnify:CR=1 FL=1
MARPKKPTKIKELQGTLQPCRQIANEMQVTEVVELPAAPNYFDDFAQKEWDITTSELSKIKMDFINPPYHAPHLTIFYIPVDMQQLYTWLENLFYFITTKTNN